jgi:hypothetical protein
MDLATYKEELAPSPLVDPLVREYMLFVQKIVSFLPRFLVCNSFYQSNNNNKSCTDRYHQRKQSLYCAASVQSLLCLLGRCRNIGDFFTMKNGRRTLNVGFVVRPSSTNRV